MSIGKSLIILGIYFLSVLVFHFIANIVCTLADWDTDYLVLYSFVWPIALVVVGILLIFSGLETASDYTADKLYDFMHECKRRKNDKANK